MKLAFAFAILLATGLCVSASPTTFKNSGLKTETVITLDVEGKRVTGTFESSEYGENGVREKFKGEVVPTPKGALQRIASSERLALESEDRESSRTSLYSHVGAELHQEDAQVDC